MRPSQAVAARLDEVRAVIARYPVSNPRVFGSVARGEDDEKSDLDLLVDPHGEDVVLRSGGARSWSSRTCSAYAWMS